jgi:hypothetical protein
MSRSVLKFGRQVSLFNKLRDLCLQFKVGVDGLLGRVGKQGVQQDR